MDPNSYANITEVKTVHLHLNIQNVSFDKSSLSAVADLLLLKSNSGEPLKKVVLDTRNLVVKNCYYSALKEDLKDAQSARKQLSQLQTEAKWSKIEYSLGKEHPAFGKALELKLPSAQANGSFFWLRIEYDTTSESMALQWLKAEQTAGKKYPYLFTQCQAIHARSLVPCQDSPSVKFTYTAEICVKKPLVALMSALSNGTKESGESQVFMFEQNVPIPSYLLALAVGELECRSLGKRSYVWCEPATLKAAEHEFQDTEKFLEAAESIVSPYSWSNCTLLLAPPSYPYGGMENPNLILLTPTLIAGDRSLVDVVAHEIAHSWAGNLVTNENWQHFWLNEGFCVYIERRIVGKLHGEDVRQFKSILGWKALEESVNLFGESSPLTCLIQNLENVDPDDAFSSVPYEKGFNFLYHLEKLLGLDCFDGWLKAHFSHFEFKSLDTYQFKDFLLYYFKQNHPEKYRLLETFDFDSWLKKPGMPPVQMPFRTPLDDECKQVADSWDKIRNQTSDVAISAVDFSKLRVEQKMVVLDKLFDKPVFPEVVLDQMDKLYRFDDYKNAEIKFRWFRLCLKAKYTKCITKAVELITTTGRMKFVRVIYRHLASFPEGKAVAIETFKKHKNFYHPICSAMVSKDLGLTK